MAISTCAKCGGHNFEVRPIEPIGERYKQNLVQCASCGVPIGVLDFLNTGTQLEEMKVQIKGVVAALDELRHRLVRIEHSLSQSR